MTPETRSHRASQAKRIAPYAFKPGQSGNPGGRRKELKEVMELARSYSEEAIGRLVFWIRSDDPRASPAACVALLDRAWGKPQQSVDVTGQLTLSALVDAALGITRAPEPEPPVIEGKAEPEPEKEE
jgi:Family of unknown function (DUF5681)